MSHVFTLTTYCGGVCVATVGGSEWGVKVNARAVGSASQSPSPCTASYLKEEERPDSSSQLSPWSCWSEELVFVKEGSVFFFLGVPTSRNQSSYPEGMHGRKIWIL